MLEYRFSMEDEDDDFEQESNINMDDDIGDYDEDDDEETIVVTETVVSSVFPPSMPVMTPTVVSIPMPVRAMKYSQRLCVSAVTARSETASAPSVSDRSNWSSR